MLHVWQNVGWNQGCLKQHVGKQWRIDTDRFWAVSYELQSTYCSSSHIGWMRQVHIVEQEQDRVQGIVLFGLPLFTSTKDQNKHKTFLKKHASVPFYN